MCTENLHPTSPTNLASNFGFVASKTNRIGNAMLDVLYIRRNE